MEQAQAYNFISKMKQKIAFQSGKYIMTCTEGVWEMNFYPSASDFCWMNTSAWYNMCWMCPLVFNNEKVRELAINLVRTVRNTHKNMYILRLINSFSIGYGPDNGIEMTDSFSGNEMWGCCHGKIFFFSIK